MKNIQSEILHIWIALIFMMVLFLFHVSTSRASDELTFRMGTGFTNNLHSAVYGISYTKNFDRVYLARMELGVFTDTQSGHRGSFNTSAMLGHRFGKLEHLYLELMVGVRIIAHTDALLGTPFNFHLMIGLGYRGYAAYISHTSNSGIRSPNIGRDEITAGYTWRF